jgi:IPT/TIG domain-containing protein/phosphate-induced protein 1
MRVRVKLLIVLAAIAALVVSAPAHATFKARISGIVAHHGGGHNGAVKASSAQNLTYHGGSVMRTNKAYAIYWIPSGYTVSGNYKSLIDGFLQNVAADSGKASNVYATDTQYYDTLSGGQTKAAYDSTFGGSVIVTDAYPAVVDQCTLESDPFATCLTDEQLQTEISNTITSQGWPRGVSNVYFLMTPDGVGSCYDAFSCSDNVYCAYHSWIGSGSTLTPYANQPYAATLGGCDPGQSPNGDDADATINVLSHEHNEAITDPSGAGWWYDDPLFGEIENGDACAWDFGTALGSTADGQYNQAIGTGKYWLQQEWSNQHGGCRLTMPAPAVVPTISGFAPSSGPVGAQVTITGANFTSVSAVSLRGVNTTYTVNSPTSISATVPNVSPDGLWRVTTPGGTAVSAARFTVVPAPTISSFSPSSGSVGANVTINGSSFGGATSVALGSVAASFTVNSGSKITAKVPAGAVSGKWKVTTPSGAATSASTFTVKISTPSVGPPTIAAFTPSKAPLGSSVTITGTNFVNVSSVYLGRARATFTVNSTTQLTARVPSGTGAGKWKVTTPKGTATSGSYFVVG